MKISFLNRRNTSRFQLYYNGACSLLDRDKNKISTQIMISDLSFSGMQIVFSNNEFYYQLLEINEITDIYVTASSIGIEDIIFNAHCLWLRVYDIGEKNFYVLMGLEFTENFFDKNKNALLEALSLKAMENIYI